MRQIRLCGHSPNQIRSDKCKIMQSAKVSRRNLQTIYGSTHATASRNNHYEPTWGSGEGPGERAEPSKPRRTTAGESRQRRWGGEAEPRPATKRAGHHPATNKARATPTTANGPNGTQAQEAQEGPPKPAKPARQAHEKQRTPKGGYTATGRIFFSQSTCFQT